MKYSFETQQFYSEALFDPKNIPSDAVDLSKSEYLSLLDGLSKNMEIANQAGRPVCVERKPVPLTREQVEANRLLAYSDPVTGSDRFFAEASRLQAMGATQEEIDAAKAAGAQRYQEIQSEHPWPVE